MMNDENSPTFGSTPAITENAITAGVRASPTTSPTSTSRVSIRGRFSAVSTEWFA